MSDAALAISFVDPARDLHGTARSGLTLLFQDRKASSVPEGPEIAEAGGGWHAALEGKLALDFSPVGVVAELSGSRAHICAVSGDAAGTRIDGLGVVTEITTPPRWEELEAVRSVHALFDPQHAVVALARRPEGSQGHGDELVVAQLLTGGELLAVEDARLSTIYDADGRPRQASMELWLPGEDFPRRAFGAVLAGASLALDGLDVHAGLFGWRMEGREGAGMYELTVREPTPAAA
ncbi:MAG: hypothetical protein ACJ76Z_16615 [Thermoleophilaceae bacterium]